MPAWKATDHQAWTAVINRGKGRLIGKVSLAVDGNPSAPCLGSVMHLLQPRLTGGRKCYA